MKAWTASDGFLLCQNFSEFRSAERERGPRDPFLRWMMMDHLARCLCQNVLLVSVSTLEQLPSETWWPRTKEREEEKKREQTGCMTGGPVGWVEAGLVDVLTFVTVLLPPLGLETMGRLAPACNKQVFIFSESDSRWMGETQMESCGPSTKMHLWNWPWNIFNKNTPLESTFFDFNAGQQRRICFS